MSISADGYVAGPCQSKEHPVGVGGEALHGWHLGPTKDHPVNRRVISEMLDGMGATIMGRNMFGPIAVTGATRTGTGGGVTIRPTTVRLRADPLFARPDRTEGRDDFFHFVTDGIEAAYAEATQAAEGRSISIAGGATCARQAIAAGIVDEIDLQVNPVILGSGERLLDGFEAGEPELELVRVLDALGVAHLRYRGYPLNRWSARQLPFGS